ncbi:MAG: class I SAM-dependent methyltransferase, partial [Candidatus Omnitrophica bacterium]|nr:class I SAM-dependent methyltransferase [Candidatus Omnitrophota bacterium]
MEKNLYLEMFEKERSNWWFQGKRLVVHSLVKKFVGNYQSVLDIGCGTGATLQEFRAKGKDVYGTDVSEEAIRFSKKRGLENIYQFDFSQEELKEKKFDLILCLDVLEHIVDDRKVLKNIKNSMHAGSYFLMTVPSFQFLWGADDVVLGHQRRYTKREIESLLREADFELV